MTIILDKIDALDIREAHYNNPQYAYLLRLPPYGGKTEDTECLSSYMSRLADRHSECVNYLSKNLYHTYLVDEETGDGEHCMIPPHNMNGISNFSSLLCQALKVGSRGAMVGEYMTFLPLRHLSTCNCHGVFDKHRHWCPLCWNDDELYGREPYTRLYWIFQEIYFCKDHGQALSNSCPHCASPQRYTDRIPRQWICRNCGLDLHKKPNKSSAATKRGRNRRTPTYRIEDSYFCRSLCVLLKRIANENLQVPKLQVANSINLYIHDNKTSLTKLANKLNFSERVLTSMANYEHAPHFPALIDFCERINVPLDQFLFDQDQFSFEDIRAPSAQTKFVTRKKITTKKKSKILAYLNSLIEGNVSPPEKLSKVGKTFGMTYNILKYHFPQEYRILKARWDSWDQQQKTLKKLKRAEAFTKCIVKLVENGEYPSHRKLLRLKKVKPNDLRRPELLSLLRHAQQGLSPRTAMD